MLIVMTMEPRYPFGRDWAEAARLGGADVVEVEVVPVSLKTSVVGRGVIGKGDRFQVQRPALRPDRYTRRISDRVVAYRIQKVIESVSRDRKVDVVHTHFYREMGPILQMRNRTAHVHTEHSAAFSANDLGDRAQYRVSSDGLRQALIGYSSADCVIAVSEYLAEQMKGSGVTIPISVLPCPIGPTITRHPIVEVNEMRLVTVGRLSPEKRVDLVFDAFAQFKIMHPDAVLDVVGGGPSDIELRAHAAELGLEGSVVWHGRLDRAELADVVARARVFVTATLSETFGTAVAEALCLGVPVVAPKVGGLVELLPDDGSRGLLVKDVSASSLADAFHAVVSTNFDRRSIAQGSRGQWSAERVGVALVDLYAAAVERHRSR